MKLVKKSPLCICTAEVPVNESTVCVCVCCVAVWLCVFVLCV